MDLITHTIKEPTFVETIFRVFYSSCIPNYRKKQNITGACYLLVLILYMER